MPDAPKPVTVLGDLRVVINEDPATPNEAWWSPATVADLVSALRAEGVLVVEKVDGEWAEWAINPINEMSRRVSKFVLDGLAEAQPFPPAGG